MIYIEQMEPQRQIISARLATHSKTSRASMLPFDTHLAGATPASGISGETGRDVEPSHHWVRDAWECGQSSERTMSRTAEGVGPSTSHHKATRRAASADGKTMLRGTGVATWRHGTRKTRHCGELRCEKLQAGFVGLAGIVKDALGLA